MQNSAELRAGFLQYFAERGHRIVPSSPLVPANDPTLLFTNAGMVQFKEVFLGREQRPYPRAVSSQRCVRAGGKHNDLENVGYTARHHTFFEMLGNFSFDDYFKSDAIQYAWDYLTRVLALPKERLWVTVYEQDREAEDIWRDHIGVPPERLVRCGEADNFWSMGETGPCGPCSELFYDHGPAVAGGPPGAPDADGDRYVEIWNLVFMEYDRDPKGRLTPLPRPSVDTGMGLERLAAVMQGTHDNYEIDLFRALIAAAAELTGCPDPRHTSLRVIADHIRSAGFLIGDGITPSNEGRGYVLRRIIRRAVRHGHRLGHSGPFFHRLVATLVAEMGAAYPELVAAQAQVERVLKIEEERFAETLEQGMRLLEQAIEGIRGDRIAGATVFKLYDTYGFPVDLTADVARERGLGLDLAGFERAMAEQKERARAASRFGATQAAALELEGETDFTGYERLADQATVMAIYRDGESLDRLTRRQEGLIVLGVTPFYAEAGGQVGDTGELAREGARAQVLDTRKQGAEVIGHIAHMTEGTLRIGDRVEARVDARRRRLIASNHSATHLLHAALREVLGDHVQQKGSLVGPDRLRFDFSHFEPVTREQLRRIERLVNREIRENHLVETRIMSRDDARTSGALALFGEKYAEQVRVLRMGGFSTELCGGTHVRALGDIGLFKIVAESGIASGVRRIEAVSGEGALDWIEADEARLSRLADLVKGTREDLDAKVAQLLEHSRRLEKELGALKARLASHAGRDLAAQALDIAGIKVLAARLEGVDPKGLRETLDRLKDQLGSAVVVLATENGGKVGLVAGITDNLTDRLRAGDLIGVVAAKVGGKGGGRADMAQAGGKDPAGLPAALELVPDWVRERVA
ncbi:MAG: alanine--tRNA ligase [Candidatus Thiosymbion ectosymbiont of Robbea hypermnestra]|nr:alanine--tRNA ligase [Candidatus Thiosymbion ectosymbiont of Robbea hypermnestra]